MPHAKKERGRQGPAPYIAGMLSTSAGITKQAVLNQLSQELGKMIPQDFGLDIEFFRQLSVSGINGW